MSVAVVHKRVAHVFDRGWGCVFLGVFDLFGGRFVGLFFCGVVHGDSDGRCGRQAAFADRGYTQLSRGLADRVKSSIADAGREVTKAWKYDRDQLKAQHKQEDQARLERTREKSDALKQGDYKTSRYEFERNQDRRKKANKLKRDTMDAFGTERTAGNDDATEDNKRNRTSAEIRAEKRA